MFTLPLPDLFPIATTVRVELDNPPSELFALYPLRFPKLEPLPVLAIVIVSVVFL